MTLMSWKEIFLACLLLHFDSGHRISSKKR